LPSDLKFPSCSDIISAPMEFRVPEKQAFKIGEVCEMMEVQPYVLRYWETEFEDLRPQKNATNQRIYRARDIEIVHLIKKLLYEEGYTIEGARRQLKKEIARLEHNGSGISQEDMAETLQRLRQELQEILVSLRSH